MTQSPQITVHSAKTHSGPAAVLKDLRDGWRMGPVWRAFAWEELQFRYRRSVLGIGWIIISYLIFVSAIAVFFIGFTSIGEKHFVYYVAVGYASYMFLIANLIDGSYVFRSSKTWILSADLPHSVYVYKGVVRAGFPFAVQLATGFCLMFVMGWRPGPGALLAIPALALYLANAVWVQLFLGLVAARFADIGHLITSVSRILFFTTPILWTYGDRTGVVKLLADINPFTHFIEIFRAPLIGDPVHALSWEVVLGVTVAGWVMTVLTAGALRRRLPYWI